MDSRRAPKPVLLTHPLNEIPQATINPRTPCPISGFPTPEGFEAGAMPTQDGLRLNHLGRTKQVWPETGHPYEQRAIAAAKSWRTPQSDIELMTEKQILSLKPNPRLENIDDEHSERMQDGKHRFQ